MAFRYTGSEAFTLVQEQLVFPAIPIVVVLAGPGILHCWGCVSSFMRELCLYNIVVQIAVVPCESLPLSDCQ